MEQRILRLPEVIKTTGLGRSTIYARISENLFPEPVNLGARSVGWLSTEIQDWIQSRMRSGRTDFMLEQSENNNSSAKQHQFIPPLVQPRRSSHHD